MKIRRWIVLALCAATLLSCVSCAGGGDPEAPDSESSSIGEHETEPEAWIQDKVPDLNFNKDTYTVLNHNAKDSAPDNLVFNRIVSLKSSFVLPKNE